MLGSCYLCRNVSSRNKRLVSTDYVYSVWNFHSLLSEVELLHFLIDVVFLTNLGAEGSPQVVASICTQGLSL